MTVKKGGAHDGGELRRKAKSWLEQHPSHLSAVTNGETRRLVQELEIHQVELELQNEELRNARIELEAGLARYTELFDFAPLGYATLAEDGTTVQVNLAGAKLLGHPRAPLYKRRFDLFVAVPYRRAFQELLARTLRSETKQTLEVELQADEDAEPVLVRLTAAAVARMAPTVLLAFEDITEQRRGAERLAQSQHALREADRRKDDFLATLSHELRNPLAPIRSSLYVLSRADPGGDRARRAQGIIERQIAHLTRLVDDLLDVNRIARGKVVLRRERVELAEHVRRVLDDHRSGFEAGGVVLEDSFEAGRFFVDADPARLTQIVGNLLGNAEKFTPRGGSVTVSVRHEGPHVAVRVCDTGAGVAPEVAAHLFEPFSQAPQTLDRSRGGLGLGLAMVRGLVELHGGTVTLSSEGPGRGTEVTVLLPLAEAAAEAEHEEPHAVQSTRRVLVIEDNEDAAESLRDALSMGGHDVRTASDGPHGLEVARAMRPEIVLCDLGLPGMDGYAVARAMRADEALSGAYLIALSGYAQPEEVQRSQDAGFDRHVAKPPNLEWLERILAEATVHEAPYRPPEPPGAQPAM